VRTIWHQAMKDVRANRLWLALWLAILGFNAIVYILAIDRVIAATLPRFLFGELQTVAQAALGWLVAIRIVTADPLDDTSAFWLTRPISRGTLLASKFGLVSCLFLGVPAVASLVVAAANGTDWRLLPRLAFEWMALDALLLWSLVLLAAITRDRARLTIVAIVVAFVFLALRFSHETVFSSAGAVLAWAVGLVAVSSLVAHQYLTRRRLRTLLLAAAALALAIGVRALWPWPMLPGLTPGQADPKVFDARRLVVALDTTGRGATYRAARELPYRVAQIYGSFDVSGLPAGWAIRPLRASGRIQFSDGSNDAVSSAWRLAWLTNAYDWESADLFFQPDAVSSVVRASMMWPSKRNTRRVETLFEMPEAVYRRHIGAPGRYEADIEFAAYEVVEAATFPLREGSRATVESERFTVVKITPASTDERLGDRLGIRLALPRFVLPWRAPENYIVLRNRARGEATMAWAWAVDTPGVGLAANSMTFGVADRPLRPTIDTTWTADAEAVIVRAIDRGRFTLHVSDAAFVVPPLGPR